MIKGPLVYAVVVLAGILIALSFMNVLFPDDVQTIGVAAGIIALLAVVVLVVIFFKTRRGTE